MSLSNHIDPYHADALALPELVAHFRAEGYNCLQTEALIRKGPPLRKEEALKRGKLLFLPLRCEHVDYETQYFLYLPPGQTGPLPLLIVGHGGNSRMNAKYAKYATMGGIKDWLPLAEEKGFAIAAPLSERGWGSIGYSIIFTMLSQLQRRVPVDPDRIFLTGHSMGGHLSWRSALYMPDRWAAVIPMSGGYDYVERGEMPLLQNVSGYATFGSREPYGIADYNRKMQPWIETHGYDWQIIEKPGGHEIFVDEIPKAAQFMFNHPRNLYRPTVWAQMRRKMNLDQPDEQYIDLHRWQADRPISRGTFHWLRLLDQPDLPTGIWQKIQGTIDRKQNRIDLTAQRARHARIYLHPKLVDFDRPVQVWINGHKKRESIVQPDIGTMLSLVREFDDWGRVFWAAIDVEIDSNRPVLPAV